MKREVNLLLNKEWANNIIPICRLLKPHSTNILFLSNKLVMIQSLMKGVCAYMIVNEKYDYSHFIGCYILSQGISGVNTRFKKTKSIIDWDVKDGMDYLQIFNPNEDPYEIPIFNRESVVDQLLETNYQRIVLQNEEDEKISIEEIREYMLYDEADELFTPVSESIISDMIDKKLCTLEVQGYPDKYPILLSKPLLGDLKKTKWVGYRIVKENENIITLKFKQREEYGNIYTYAAFLKI